MHTVTRIHTFYCLVIIFCDTVFSHVHHTSTSKTSHFQHEQHSPIKCTDVHSQEFTPVPRSLKPHDDGCSNNALCGLPVQCPAHVTDSETPKCIVPGGRLGICCSTGQNHTDFVHHKGRGHHQFVHVDPVILGSAARHSRIELSELHHKVNRILNSGRSAIVPLGSASYGHFRNSRLFNPGVLIEVMSVASRALEIALATKEFKDRQGVTNQQIEYGMIKHDLRTTPLGSACVPPPVCPLIPHRHRRIDGSCNNLVHTGWGAPLTPYSRLLPPSYQDGVWSPRVSEDKGQPLSSPRLISTTIFHDKDSYNTEYTLMLMQFGQFMSHDITQSIDTTFANGSGISCCNSDGSNALPPDYRHYACMPIAVPYDDFFFSGFKQGCMNFVRSVLAPKQDCTLGYAEQMNKVSHFLDGSVIYGSSSEQTGSLRSFEGGRLKVFHDFGRDLLPLSDDTEACLTMEQGSACFSSVENENSQILKEKLCWDGVVGSCNSMVIWLYSKNIASSLWKRPFKWCDTRTNQMVSLVVVHLIFTREHNRVADELSQLNPHWGDEHLFLEARRIVTAELQVIVYKEFLPALLGEAAMEEFNLALEQDINYSYDYDQRVEPSVMNEYAAAAFRFGHSMVDSVMKIYGSSRMDEAISIPEIMFHPARLRKKPFYDQLLSTLTTEPIQEVDNSLSEAMTKYMFRAGNPFGVDIASINIQRGRDHGLRPYNDYRELVGQPRLTHFEEFGEDLATKLKSVYASVDDIDLWVGGLLEPKYGGSVLGWTFRDIIAEQFSRLKKGDRYFFEHDPSINPGHFSGEQLKELRQVSMSRLVCDNRDGILLARQAPNAFRTPGVPGNEFVDCSSPVIPHLNLIHWQDIYKNVAKK